MGGLLVLLAVAVTSVTYGWQPDGTGGVEYLVQVSPDKLAQVRSTGEISSTIPAEIRGHVSRVVIRVGDGPLPRTISSAMQQSAEADRLSAADHQNVPIPQMGSQPADQFERVMKPQDGFTFPDAAARAGDRVAAGANDAASRLRSDATNALNGLRDNTASAFGSAAEDLRNRAAERVSQGAGSLLNAGDDVMRRAADRTSAAARDNKWFQLNSDARNLPSTDPVRAPNAGSLREPPFVGPTRPGDMRSAAASSQYTQAELDQIRRNDQANTNARLANTRTATEDQSAGQNDRGFGSSGFGMMPAGMSTPRSVQEEEQRRATTLRDSRSEIGFADARLQLNDTSRRATDPFADPRAVDSRQATLQNRTGVDPRYEIDPRYGDDARRSVIDDRNSRTSTWADQSNATNLAADRLRARDVDPRLSKADVDRLPTGAWSFDIYDNPIDKQGLVLDRHGIPVSAQKAHELTYGRNAPAVTQPQIAMAPGMPSTGGMMVPNFGQTTMAGVSTGTQFSPLTPNQNNMSGGPIHSRPPLNPDAINSASDRNGPGRGGDAGERTRQSLAAQPLFNFLLLMSIVANVYLVFWLKNLRHQFHDLVSSKRIATSEAVGI